MVEARLTALKVTFKGEIHRIRVDLNSFKLEDLHNLFCETFKLAPSTFVIQYKDGEGDHLNVVSDAEFDEACRVFLSEANGSRALRFFAVTRTQFVFQENVSEPVLKALERLVETLQCAVEKVKKEEWARRAQTGMEQTREAMMNAAEGARGSFDAARQSFHEIPFDQVLKETTDGLKQVAQNIGSFAQDVVEEIKSVTSPTPEHVNEPSNNDQENSVQSEASTESEWEDVATSPVATATPVAVEEDTVVISEHVPQAQLVEAAPAVVAPPIVSEEEKKWAEQLSLINSILPGLDTNRLISLLEQANGNVQIVLNSLMEDM